jgi:hypothetical protein
MVFMINDEKGLFFAFGPWWFVIIVMIIAFVAGLIRQNNASPKNVDAVNDYIPTEKSGKLIVRMLNFVLTVVIH